ncbi:MAG: ATP-binding protein [Pirellulales bacterium]
MSGLWKPLIPRSAVLKQQLDTAIIEGDRAQVRQILLNLMTNAFEAIQSDGLVTLRVGVRHVDRSTLDGGVVADRLADGEYAFVEVVDTGCGMTPATLERIFDPFFSTKFSGRGLGLAAVLGIVRSHRGTVRVSSREGAGTTFEAYFPAKTGATPTAPAATSSSVPSTAKTILVVDDDEAVRRSVTFLLKESGFQILQAGDGNEAHAIVPQASEGNRRGAARPRDAGDVGR